MKSLTAEIKEFSLNEIIFLLSRYKKTGKVSVKGDNTEGEVFIEDGKCVHAQINEIEGLDALLTLSQLMDGELSFETGKLPPKHSISGNTTTLFEQIEKRSYEIRDIQKKLPPIDAILVKSDTPPDENLRLRKTDWKVLAQVNGKKNIKEVIEDSKLGAIESYRCLSFLMEKGLIVDPDASKRRLKNFLKFLNLFLNEFSKGEIDSKKKVSPFIINTVHSHSPVEALSNNLYYDEKKTVLSLKGNVNLAPQDVDEMEKKVLDIFLKRIEKEFGKILGKKKVDAILKKMGV